MLRLSSSAKQASGSGVGPGRAPTVQLEGILSVMGI